MKTRSYLLIGGPLNGTRVETDGRPYFRVALRVEVELTELLEASIVAYERGAAAVPKPDVKTAVYKLSDRVAIDDDTGQVDPKLKLFDHTAYRFEGYE